jgi:GST-like protein
MLDVYFAATPNGMKIKLFLEELAERGVPLPHRLVLVRLSKGEQFRPEFLAISPNGKIPAIVDHDPPDGGEPLAMFESGAILQYLADKTGELLSRDLRVRAQTLQWLQWQMAGLGPMAGQAGWFRVYAPQRDAFAIERYTRETGRLYGVLDRHLADRRFIAGEAISIADIACWPWIVSHAGHGQSLEDLPHLSRWFRDIADRPATRRAFAGYEDPYAAGAGPAVATATDGVAA